MRKLALLGAVAMFACVSSMAGAQQNAVVPVNKNQRVYNVINCQDLKGHPQTCLSNETDEYVINIGCIKRPGILTSGGEWAIKLPGRGLPPHSFTVMNMGSCKTDLNFSFEDGSERKILNVNTDAAALIEVPKK